MKKIAALFFAICMFYTISLAKWSDTFKLDKQLSVLNNKATLSFPSIAKIKHSTNDVNLLTNIMLEFEDIKLTFHFVELFMLGDSNLLKQILKEEKQLFPAKGYTNLLFYTLNSSSYNFKRKILHHSDELLSVLSTPQLYRTGLENILINMMLVKTADNSIFLTEVYVNKIGFKIKDSLTVFSENILQTLQNGTRKNDRSKRVVYFKDEILDTKKYFRFKLPENYTVTVADNGERFTIHKYTNFVDSNWVTFSIYPVYPPMYEYGEEPDMYGFDNTDNRIRVKGKFLKIKVDWITYSNEKKKAFLKEENIDPNDIGLKGPYIHVFMATNSASNMKEMTKILESIKLKRKLYWKVID